MALIISKLASAMGDDIVEVGKARLFMTDGSATNSSEVSISNGATIAAPAGGSMGFIILNVKELTGSVKVISDKTNANTNTVLATLSNGTLTYVGINSSDSAAASNTVNANNCDYIIVFYRTPASSTSQPTYTITLS